MATLLREPEAAPATQRPARITEAEYMRMCDAGVFEPDHVELVGGVLERMAPSGPPHGELVVEIGFGLRQAYPRQTHRIVTDVYTRLERDLIRAPDVSVLLAPLPDKVATAEGTLLVVEVAASTRDYDLRVKSLDYARAGIAHCWVVDVGARETHVLTRPRPEGYAVTERVAFDAPLAIPATDRTLVLANDEA